MTSLLDIITLFLQSLLSFGRSVRDVRVVFIKKFYVLPKIVRFFICVKKCRRMLGILLFNWNGSTLNGDYKSYGYRLYLHVLVYFGFAVPFTITEPWGLVAHSRYPSSDNLAFKVNS